MKAFKIIDCCVSLFLLAWTIYSLFADNKTDLLIYLFLIGAWHIISMFVHFFAFRSLSAVRNLYHWLILPAVPLMLSIIHPFLTIAGPAMATFYTALCFVETFSLFRHENK